MSSKSKAYLISPTGQRLQENSTLCLYCSSSFFPLSPLPPIDKHRGNTFILHAAVAQGLSIQVWDGWRHKWCPEDHGQGRNYNKSSSIPADLSRVTQSSRSSWYHQDWGAEHLTFHLMILSSQQRAYLVMTMPSECRTGKMLSRQVSDMNTGPGKSHQLLLTLLGLFSDSTNLLEAQYLLKYFTLKLWYIKQHNLIHIFHLYYIHIVLRYILRVGLLVTHLLFGPNEFSFNKQTKAEKPKKTSLINVPVHRAFTSWVPNDKWKTSDPFFVFNKNLV